MRRLPLIIQPRDVHVVRRRRTPGGRYVYGWYRGAGDSGTRYLTTFQLSAMRCRYTYVKWEGRLVTIADVMASVLAGTAGGWEELPQPLAVEEGL